MDREMRAPKKNNRRLWAAAAGVLAVLIVIGAAWWWMKVPDGDKAEEEKQEFKKLEVVQFYLHIPGGDVIIGRQNLRFKEMLNLSQKIATAIVRPAEGSPTSKTQDIPSLNIQQGSISLSVWLIEPQKISTRMNSKDKEKKDKYDNRVLETDRIVILLGGEQAGTVYLKKPGKEQWTGWEVEDSQLAPLVESVRKGGI